MSIEFRIVRGQLHINVGDWIQITEGGQLYASTLSVMLDHGVPLHHEQTTGMIALAISRLVQSCPILNEE